VTALLIAGVSISFSQTSNNSKMQLNLMIDGSKNPELVTDDVAYRHFLTSIAAEGATASPAVELRRREAKLKPLGLAKPDHDNLLQHVDNLRGQLKGIDSAERRLILDESVAALKSKLSATANLALDKYIQKQVKPHIKFYGGSPHADHALLSKASLSSRRSGLSKAMQGMGYYVSIYSNAWVSGNTLLATSTTDDESQGCWHDQYNTTAVIDTPGGNSSGYASGAMEADSEIGLDNFGTYYIYSYVWFYCSCANYNIYVNGGGSGYTPSIYDLIQQDGLSDIVQSVTDNGNGTYSLALNYDDAVDLDTAFQMYGDGCSCDQVGQAIHDAIVVAIAYAGASILIQEAWWLDKLGLIHRERTPAKGQPANSIQTYPSPQGQQAGQTVRIFDENGRAIRDIDYGDQAHDPNAVDGVEVHDWDWSKQPPRQPGRAPAPGDIPSGYPTTWPPQ
jgi:hypothetical protein